MLFPLQVENQLSSTLVVQSSSRSHLASNLKSLLYLFFIPFKSKTIGAWSEAMVASRTPIALGKELLHQEKPEYDQVLLELLHLRSYD
ncbi:hypothetical protein V6N12_066676 [Hibiscus sabdariffa]|uniref:Uncharacterized protein n=1 Tax=Hibiscus sabdariffa TaxID=183260 RepID=A0ABR2BDK7_9ROSI